LCTSELQRDRLIKVYVADNATPYLIQAAILSNIAESFIRALKNQESVSGEKGVLKLPKDDQEALEILYWKF
jgi:hypothetical protein